MYYLVATTVELDGVEGERGYILLPSKKIHAVNVYKLDIRSYFPPRILGIIGKQGGRAWTCDMNSDFESAFFIEEGGTYLFSPELGSLRLRAYTAIDWDYFERPIYTEVKE